MRQSSVGISHEYPCEWWSCSLAVSEARCPQPQHSTYMRKACAWNRTIIQRCPRRSKDKGYLLVDRSVINDDGSEVRSILELPQIYTQNHSDPTSDCTSITALWSLVLDWRQQAVYECHFFFLKLKKRARGGYGVRIEAGEGDRMGCFCQQSSGHRVHSALNMSCSGGADRDLQTGCRQEQREGRRSIRCDVLGPTVRITMTGAKAPLPSLLNRTAPRSSIYF